MTNTKDGVIPRSGLKFQMPPGAAAPRSGVYEHVGPRGGRTGEQLEVTRGQPLPQGRHPEGGWRLVRTSSKSGK
jgi:hypothetical protein